MGSYLEQAQRVLRQESGRTKGAIPALPRDGKSASSPYEVNEENEESRREAARLAVRPAPPPDHEEAAKREALRALLGFLDWPRTGQRGGLKFGPGEAAWERWFGIAQPAQVREMLKEVRAETR